MLNGAKFRYGILLLPAMNGASARTRPMKRPIRIVLPAVAGEVALDLLQALVGDPEALAVLDEEPAAEPRAEQEADGVARRRRRAR